MSRWNFITNLFNTPSQQWQFETLPADRVEGGTPSIEAKANQHYFRLTLAEMFLADSQKWGTTRHPITHSLVKLKFGAGDAVEIPSIAGKMQLRGFESAGQDSVIRLNYPLTPRLPFSGGIVTLEAGLMSLRSDNLLATYAKTLGDFATLLNVPAVSSALQIAQPLATGLQELLGAGEAEVRLGLHQTFSGQSDGAPLTSGYLVTLAATEDELPPGQLWIRNGRLHRGTTMADSTPMTGVDYLLFRLDVFAERDDWRALEYIKKPWQSAMTYRRQGERETANVYFNSAQTAVIESHDLTEVDKIRILNGMDKEFKSGQPSDGFLNVAPEPRDGALSTPMADSDETAASSTTPKDELARLAGTMSYADAMREMRRGTNPVNMLSRSRAPELDDEIE
ncbi:hypothetical protein SCOR_30680 [Sulfidibacter corallicola]|uniref:Uncharacterized protein n=1 Tax=Sulfidibacter corallicola TaxID=2818388 RepID=A0A8A4TMF6_SULCO|nr:hypothetical protein [Sulfidibacter corallicola]QTD50078.1 hypothetical protein J3U87_31220 [Sulfidibacter corallicola]